MEFTLTADEQAFASDVRDFLRDHPLTEFPVDGMDAGYGSGANSKAFIRALAAQGWISMCWPKAFGGAERPMFFKLVLMEQLALAGAPFGQLPGIWQTAAAIIDYGSERLRAEVFLDDVRVPEALRLGPEGEGFVALLNGLDSDRFWGRFYKAPALQRVLRRLVDHANTTMVNGAPLARDPFVRRRLAGLATDIEALRWLFYRAACLLRDGAPITYETAVAKVLADETGQKLARVGMDLLGLWAPLRPGSEEAKLDGEISHAYLTSLGHTIAGGTAEILRTTVATRGLGLPTVKNN